MDERKKVKKRCLGLNDVFDDEYHVSTVASMPIPSPSMVIPLERSLQGNYLVRACYLELYDIIMTSKAPTIIVTGNPGVGKSAFYVYFYTRLLSDNRMPQHLLVYENSKEEPVLYVHNGDIRKLKSFQEKQELFGELSDQPVWHLIDGCNEKIKPHLLGRTIVFSSPNRKKMNLLDDDVNLDKLYVPPWTLEELNICRELFYPMLEYDELVKRFYRFGGVPRFIFADNQSNVNSKIGEALAKANFCKHVELPQTMGKADSDDYSHRLLHMIPCDNYSSYYLKFASEFIGSQLFHNFFTECRNDLFKFLVESEGVMEASGYRGYLFEMLAHKKLSAGGSFTIKNLKTGEIDTLTLNPSVVHVFSTSSEIKEIDTAKYYRPRVKNYESLDSFKANWIFQMGIGSNHPIKVHGIREFLKVRGLFENSTIVSSDSIILIFVVPPERFFSYSTQNFVFKKDSNDSNGVVPNWTSAIEQYALTFEFSD